MGFDFEGVQQLIVNTIDRVDSTLREELFANVFVCGGTTSLQGFDDRLSTEIKRIVPNSNVKVKHRLGRDETAWCGTSLEASSPGFLERMIVMEDYDECGASVVHRKCV
jgi:actin-related protein